MQKLLFSGLLESPTPETTPKFYTLRLGVLVRTVPLLGALSKKKKMKSN